MAAPIAVTVEGRWRRRLTALVVVALLGGAAFVGGQAVADRLGEDRTDEVAAGNSDDRPDAGSVEGPTSSAPVSSDASPADTTTDGDPDPAPVDPERSDTLRFEPFPEPLVLIDAETDPEFNNSTGVHLAGIDRTGDGEDQEPGSTSESGREEPGAAAVVADLVATGPAGATVSVHPGDRPADALRFTIPDSGRILIPHLIAAADDGGRIVVSGSEQIRVKMEGLGTYVPSSRTRAGRFVTTGSRRIGSLVTATDGRELTISLSDELGPESAHVGRAVIRMNANVGPTGGSVRIGSGPDIPWPAPAALDQGMAGTELLTVTPDDNGDILIDYLGGSVLTVDLVGYYTNDAAPESAAGLFVMAGRPALQTIDIGAGSRSLELDETVVADRLQRAVVLVEASNGENGGSVAFDTDGAPGPTGPAFALAPNQRRATTEWFDPAAGLNRPVDAPQGAVLRVWTIGGYT